MISKVLTSFVIFSTSVDHQAVGIMLKEATKSTLSSTEYSFYTDKDHSGHNVTYYYHHDELVAIKLSTTPSEDEDLWFDLEEIKGEDTSPVRHNGNTFYQIFVGPNSERYTLCVGAGDAQIRVARGHSSGADFENTRGMLTAEKPDKATPFCSPEGTDIDNIGKEWLEYKELRKQLDVVDNSTYFEIGSGESDIASTGVVIVIIIGFSLFCCLLCPIFLSCICKKKIEKEKGELIEDKE